MRRRVVVVHAVRGMRLLMAVFDGDSGRAAITATRAQHRRGYRAPNREQERQQHEDDDTEGLHVRRLSVTGSVRGAARPLARARAGGHATPGAWARLRPAPR